MWFELPLPFDTASIWGWYIYYITASVLELMYILCMVSATTYFVSCCFYIGAMCDHFDFVAHSIQKNFNDDNHKEMNPYQRKMFNEKIMAKMRKAIQIHMEIDR